MVERRTVVGWQASLGRWFKSGSKDFWFVNLDLSEGLTIHTLIASG